MAELNVIKKTIESLFCEMQNRKFIIPDFQRPYKWDTEKCETLWNDIENFFDTDAKNGSNYFLGTIVSYKNNENNLEVIDGQQRIISFMLMLRSFYQKLEEMTIDDHVIVLKSKLAPCIWDTDGAVLKKVSDKTKIHISSQVATEEDNNTFHNILETGKTNTNAIDNYSVNYQFFKNKCDDYAARNPMRWRELCITILEKCIILPIECDTQETTLTIFSTLNDRGMLLADSDIFKAQIYKTIDTKEKRNDFTNTWKELMQICKHANLAIDDIFRYYTHILRARNNDKSKEVGLRSFYEGIDKKYARLKDTALMDEIMGLANFWLYLNTNKIDNDCKYVVSKETRKFLHCLSCYPNEYWKYAAGVFFMKNRYSETFDTDFCILLKKLTAFLFAKFIDSPTVNAIKDDIFASCISINNNNMLQIKFNFDEENKNTIQAKIKNHSSAKLSKSLLLLDAYLNPNQIELIPKTVEIEHILPKKWQDTNYQGWDFNTAKQYIDCFGNKVVLEKKLNIQAGNEYFGTKKKEYSLSNIANVIKLSNYNKNYWIVDDIVLRENEFTTKLINFFEEQLS
ncbi:MAG: DUF262 domain-containing HNH endonuclease family protein [Mycoplasmataceae bacterium]|jgi:uncharacterized protein with ParB-like and HNH nuclease domain|nr:DUF262 domain-containing HNH endonuclease family protein [Mycoplasmataceae bacterium]